MTTAVGQHKVRGDLYGGTGFTPFFVGRYHGIQILGDADVDGSFFTVQKT